jgi:outer membrane protein TolC
LQVRRAVRRNWLETYYWVQAAAVVNETRSLFTQLVEITRDRYAAGRQNQQDVLRAELELGLLDDRQTRILASEDVQRAELARWIGREVAQRPLPGKLQSLPHIPALEQLRAGLATHPAIQSKTAKVAASQEAVNIAREAYKPEWMLDVSYGLRGGENPDGSDRSDFLSAMVMVDLPVFAKKRQDRRLAASQHRVNAAVQMREESYRELQRMLDTSYADWRRLGERMRRYVDELLPQAAATAEAALTAYQSDRGDFTMLMRARITELETRLQYLRLRIDHAKNQANLLYLAGEDT